MQIMTMTRSSTIQLWITQRLVCLKVGFCSVYIHIQAKCQTQWCTKLSQLTPGEHNALDKVNKHVVSFQHTPLLVHVYDAGTSQRHFFSTSTTPFRQHTKQWKTNGQHMVVAVPHCMESAATKSAHLSSSFVWFSILTLDSSTTSNARAHAS